MPGLAMHHLWVLLYVLPAELINLASCVLSFQNSVMPLLFKEESPPKGGFKDMHLSNLDPLFHSFLSLLLHQT